MNFLIITVCIQFLISWSYFTGSGSPKASQLPWLKSGSTGVGCPFDLGLALWTNASFQSPETSERCVRGWWKMWTTVSQGPTWCPQIPCFVHSPKIFSLLSQRSEEESIGYCGYCISRRFQHNLLSNREIMSSCSRIYEHVWQSLLMSESPSSFTP